eukprot:gene4629-6508_t
MKLLLKAFCASTILATTTAFYTNNIHFNHASKWKTQSTVTDLKSSIESSAMLKVPASAWRWPATWPFPNDFFDLVESTNRTFDDNLLTTLPTSFEQHIIDQMQNDSSTPLSMKNILELGLKPSLSKNIFNYTFANIGSNAIDHLYFPSESFDYVIVSSGIEALVKPRELFQEVWRLLKPQGKCFVGFNGQVVLPESLNPAKMWTTMNDEQKVWITGSYLHYSAVSGWEQIEGYDLVGATKSGELIFNKQSNTLNTTSYLVQAQKIDIPTLDSISSNDNVSDYLFKSMLSIKNMETDDRKFVAIRLAAQNDHDSTYWTNNLNKLLKLQSIYNVLKEIKEVIIPSPVKAMLAAFILDKWTGSELQVSSLRMAVSLDPPSADFWLPLGQATALLPPKQKIYLLADMVSRLSDDSLVDRMQETPQLITEVFQTLCDRLPESDKVILQQFAADIVISDYLDSNLPKDDAKNRLTRFIQTYSKEAIAEMIQNAN